MYKKLSALAKGFFIGAFCTFITVSALAQGAQKTIENLNKALKGESNAKNKYELFAKKAEEESYHQIAKLFRAVSISESIHRDNHKRVITELDGIPDEIELDTIIIGSTKDNVESPIKNEAYEKSIMYPDFIAQAEADNAKEAVKSFLYAKKAEKQHENFFKAAARNFSKNRPTDYCVSKITGATYAVGTRTQCPLGKHGEEDEYIRIE